MCSIHVVKVGEAQKKDKRGRARPSYGAQKGAMLCGRVCWWRLLLPNKRSVVHELDLQFWLVLASATFFSAMNLVVFGSLWLGRSIGPPEPWHFLSGFRILVTIGARLADSPKHTKQRVVCSLCTHTSVPVISQKSYEPYLGYIWWCACLMRL